MLETPDTTKGAPLWRRFAAMVYDSFLLLALTMAYGALATLAMYLLKGDTSGGEYQPMVTSDFGNALVLMGLILTLSGFYVFFWCRAGQTAGMKAWRLKVIAVEHLPASGLPSLKLAAIRAPLALLSLLLLCLGYFWRWFDASGDCLHDKLSNTRVIVTPSLKQKKA